MQVATQLEGIIKNCVCLQHYHRLVFANVDACQLLRSYPLGTLQRNICLLSTHWTNY